MELSSGSSSELSRCSVKDQSGYPSGNNEVSRNEILPGVSLAKNQGWEDRGIETSKKPLDGFKKPAQSKTGGKANTKTKPLEQQYSSKAADGEATSSGKAKRLKKEAKECKNKEVKNIVVEAAEGLPPRKVQVWVKFLKDFGIVYKAANSLYTAGRHPGIGSTAGEMQAEILDRRWAVTEEGEFVLSARGKKIAEREKGSDGNRKLISPWSKCGVTTTED